MVVSNCQRMKRKKLIIGMNAAIGPLLLALLLIAGGSEHLRSYAFRGDGGMHGPIAVSLALAMLYSLVFQLWLCKIVWEPGISRAFDQIGRR